MIERYHQRRKALAQLSQQLDDYESFVDEVRNSWPEMRSLLLARDDAVMAVLVKRIDTKLADLAKVRE